MTYTEVLQGILEIQKRQQRYLETLSTQQRDMATRLTMIERHNGQLISHVIRLVRAKEVALEIIGTMSLTAEQRSKLSGPDDNDPLFFGEDIRRALRDANAK